MPISRSPSLRPAPPWPSSPAALRNRAPIAEVLRTILPATGKILEIASGTGEHILYFAEHFPQILWQPSDTSEAALETIEGWRGAKDFPNILPAIKVDASASETWPIIDGVTAILCCNMVHISPWAATEGLMRGAEALLAAGDLLILYGPYIRDGVETAPSNLAFDADLKRRNPAWGLRSLELVAELATAHGFTQERIMAMPANNITVIFRKNA